MQVIITTKADAPQIASANPRGAVVALLSQTLYRGGISVPLCEDYFRYITALIARRGMPISRDELIDAIWGEDEDGGPDTAEARVQSIYPIHVRRRIERLGLGIRSGYGRGYCIEELPSHAEQRRAA
jgi:DNA-binding response OmpR family regulator